MWVYVGHENFRDLRESWMLERFSGVKGEKEENDKKWYCKSNYIRLCKLVQNKKSSLFTHFESKNTHIS